MGGAAFSVRARMAKDKAPIFVTGWPDGRFEFYLGNLPQSSAPELRAKILTHPVFTEVGKHTLRAQVNGQADDALLGIYDTIIAEIEGKALAERLPFANQ